MLLKLSQPAVVKYYSNFSLIFILAIASGERAARLIKKET
jgi:hypothetical protein